MQVNNVCEGTFYIQTYTSFSVLGARLSKYFPNKCRREKLNTHFMFGIFMFSFKVTTQKKCFMLV